MRDICRSAIAALVLLLSVPTPVDAQAPPDIVRLRDGGMVRGTISEHVPGSHVIIVLVSGELRRIPAADVVWAGPADEMPRTPSSGVSSAPHYGPDVTEAPSPSSEGYRPPRVIPAPPGRPVAAPPGTPVSTETVPVRFEADREGVRVDLRVGTAHDVAVSGGRFGVVSSVVERPLWQQLCLAPCTQEMTVGRFQIGVSLGESRTTYLIQEGIEARSPTSVQIHWGDRYLIRVIGAIAWAIVGGLGTAALIAGGVECRNNCLGVGSELIVAGAITVGVSTAVGLPLVFLKDEISFQLGPL